MNRGEIKYIDIWSRPGKWAKQRAYIFLFINLVVYCAFNILLYWMHSNTLVDFSWTSYKVAIFEKTLIDLLVFPIGVNEAPILIFIIGFLIAIIVIVPILIAQLYGFGYSLFFILSVILFAHLPGLSLFLLAACFIAVSAKYYYRFKFGVSILGLVPILLYFYLSTRGLEITELRSISPSLIYITFVVAFICSTIISAVVLFVAHLFKYRPGGILIGTLPFFIIPVYLFWEYIGVDQLEFRMIVHQYAPAGREAKAVDISVEALESAIDEWRRIRVCDFDVFARIAKEQLPYLAQRLVFDERVFIEKATDQFLKKYPKSRYAANVLYIKGIGLDMRFDHSVLERSWLVSYANDFVSPQSKDIWRQILNDYPHTIYAQVARLRLAILAIREERVEDALILLLDLLDHSNDVEKEETRDYDEETYSVFSSVLKEIFRRPEGIALPQIQLDVVVDHAQELVELIQYNSYDLKYGNKPLAELFCLDPHHPSYSNHLIELSVRYADSKLYDNLLVLYALSERDSNRTFELLSRYAKLFDGRDAQAWALYNLGILTESKAICEMNVGLFQQAQEYYRQILDKFPNSIFADRVFDRMHKISRIRGKIY